MNAKLISVGMGCVARLLSCGIAVLLATTAAKAGSLPSRAMTPRIDPAWLTNVTVDVWTDGLRESVFESLCATGLGCDLTCDPVIVSMDGSGTFRHKTCGCKPLYIQGWTNSIGKIPAIINAKESPKSRSLKKIGKTTKPASGTGDDLSATSWAQLLTNEAIYVLLGVVIFVAILVREQNRGSENGNKAKGTKTKPEFQNALVPTDSQQIPDHRPMPEMVTMQKCVERFDPSNIHDPDKLFAQLVDEAVSSGIVPPTVPAGRDTAVATVTGNVRTDNQDYCLSFQLGGITTILVADGCGGVNYGAYAAYVAVREAARFLIDQQRVKVKPDIVPLARDALLHAAEAMGKLVETATTSFMGGFRTTLIVVLADERRYAFAYAGDGGGVIVRRNGTIEKFLFPQKADPDIPNVITTSLGPTLIGEPASGAVPRYPGDLMITGSDGVWDYVRDDYPLAVVQYLAKAKGNVKIATKAVIVQLENYVDKYGHVCSDNITLGMMATPVQSLESSCDMDEDESSHMKETSTLKE
ncbi:MAG: protein phosphatase 2C domain-containing protein [bacterium]